MITSGWWEDDRTKIISHVKSYAYKCVEEEEISAACILLMSRPHC